jgi:ArsR family metal-binding transcriptional regulator
MSHKDAIRIEPYTITRMLSCKADLEKIRVIAEGSA